jgi:hypothetical protein
MRVRAARFGLAATLAAAALVATAAPAWAHHPVLSGMTVCWNGDHVVKWDIGNSETGSGRNMTIASATATVGATNYGVAGYVSPVKPGGVTYALTVVPANVKGTVLLTVKGTWSDGSSGTRSTTVTLVEDCVPTTTSTTTPPTTTPETTTPPTTTPETAAPARSRRATALVPRRRRGSAPNGALF